MKKQQTQKSTIFINPRGYIDQVYFDTQTAGSVLLAIKQLRQHAKKIEDQKQPVLIFIDVSQLTKIDLSGNMRHVRVEAMQAMKEIKFKRAAICAPLPIQVLVNTMALVTGKRDRVKIFENRPSSIKWLLDKK